MRLRLKIVIIVGLISFLQRIVFEIIKQGYKSVKGATGKQVNIVDAFLADVNNEWFFIEFKDTRISNKAKKDNIKKKGMANWLMLLDIFEKTGDKCKDVFGVDNTMQFAREHITYILVCSQEKNPYVYEQVRNHDTTKETYTPECLQKFKEYFF